MGLRRLRAVRLRAVRLGAVRLGAMRMRMMGRTRLDYPDRRRRRRRYHHGRRYRSNYDRCRSGGYHHRSGSRGYHHRSGCRCNYHGSTDTDMHINMSFCLRSPDEGSQCPEQNSAVKGFFHNI